MEENNREIAVKISGVKKRYKLGQVGGGTLKADMESWWAKVRGKEDPNSIIGEDERSNGTVFMALNGVDLTIYKGEAVGIIGSNGAGKSTLLKLLSRVTAPTEGEIDLYGRITSMLEVGTGFSGELTGRENVYMNGAILGMTKAEIDAKMEQIIEFSEVREFIDTPVKRYSSGMFVKLAFSVAAHLDSEIMIMDEVLAVGDVNFQTKCLDKMREAAKQEGRTVLYVSHNMNTIRTLCDRCIVLDKGKIIFIGEVNDAINIYLKNTIDNISDTVDLERILRTEEQFGTVVRLKKLQFNNSDAMIENGQCLDFSIDLSSKIISSSLCLRCMVYFNDGMPVGMASTLTNELKINEGDNHFNFILDTKLFASGKYWLKIAVYETNRVGNEIQLDVVDNVANFVIKETKGTNNMSWKHRWWGHIMMNKLEITDKI